MKYYQILLYLCSSYIRKIKEKEKKNRKNIKEENKERKKENKGRIKEKINVNIIQLVLQMKTHFKITSYW